MIEEKSERDRRMGRRWWIRRRGRALSRGRGVEKRGGGKGEELGEEDEVGG